MLLTWTRDVRHSSLSVRLLCVSSVIERPWTGMRINRLDLQQSPATVIRSVGYPLHQSITSTLYKISKMTGPIRCDRSRRNSRLCGTCSRTENRNKKTRPSQPATRFIVNVCDRHERHVKKNFANIAVSPLTEQPFPRFNPGCSKKSCFSDQQVKEEGQSGGFRGGGDNKAGVDSILSRCASRLRTLWSRRSWSHRGTTSFENETQA